MRLWQWLVPMTATVAVLAWSDLAHSRAGGRRLGPPAPSAGSGEVVVVFGVRNRSRRANLLNRYRVRIGLRSRRAGEPASKLIFSGGATSPGVPPEALLMAEYARSLGVRPEEIELEVESRTTWDNVRHVIPMLEGADRIVFASNALHAEKARAYLWRLRPDLAERLARADDHRVGELLLIEPVLAWVGLKSLRHMAAGEALSRARR